MTPLHIGNYHASQNYQAIWCLGVGFDKHHFQQQANEFASMLLDIFHSHQNNLYPILGQSNLFCLFDNFHFFDQGIRGDK